MKAPIKRKAVVRAKPASAFKLPTSVERELREKALAFAISVSAVDNYSGAAGQWVGLMPAQPMQRMRHAAPASIVSTAETFFAFLRA